MLVAAYACDPYRGSEMAVGWSWVTAIARNHHVWVITADWQRESIERFIACAPTMYSNIHFAYVTAKPWHYSDANRFWRMCEGSILKPLMHLSYKIWQRDALKLARELHEKVQFDVVHQLTFVGFRFPGHLWKLDIPFVWGPIGGLENTPWRLLPAMGVRGAAYYGARNLVNSMHRRFLRLPRKAFAAAGPGVIAATGGIRREIQRWYGVDAEVICEVGLSPQTCNTYAMRRDEEPLRIAWSGRHLPGKALHLLLRALSHVPDTTDWRLDIYGDGPCKLKWQRLAAEFGIESRCTWHGQVSRAEALAGLKSTHLFVTTSLKDLTSTVILEALASGVPVICPDHCGFPDVVSDRCGIRIPIRNIREFEAGLSRGIIEIARYETMRCRLAAGALRSAREFSWEAKVEAIDRVYQRVLAARPERMAQRLRRRISGPVL